MTHPTDQTLRLPITGMSCAACVGRVEKALRAAPGVTRADVNLALETAEVAFSTPATPADVVTALDRAGYPARVETLELAVEGMTCASCVGRVEAALAAVPGVIAARVNLASETAQVDLPEGQDISADLIKAVAAAGYEAHRKGETIAPPLDRKAAEAEALTRKLLLAAALALPVFVAEMGGHLYPPFHHWIMANIGMQTSWMLQFVLTSIVLFGPGRQFYLKGLPALLRGAPDMNSLVALGTLAAFGYSTVATFAPAILPAGSVNVYYESAAVIVVLILLGRALEARAKGRTGAAIRALVGLRPSTARVERDGATQDLPIAEIVVGDVVLTRPGERLAVDGEVLTGDSNVDESMITGEPVPVAKAAGATITGGTVNGTGSLTFRASRVGSDTTLA
ncbi:MAG: heavy metal translocating P-type ATPase, partial [Pseudomonadota bacterium]|nr:heavy metal translocating P-type ATPase [Pseudomonadota bacterium]